MSTKSSKTRKNFIIGFLLLIVIAVGVYWFLISEKFGDTSGKKADFSVSANDFLTEFGNNLEAANTKYKDKYVSVSGRVTETDATAAGEVNVKFSDTTGNYIIFAFQDQDIDDAQKLKTGDSVTIKANFSQGIKSDILETTSISFKRATVSAQH